MENSYNIEEIARNLLKRQNNINKIRRNKLKIATKKNDENQKNHLNNNDTIKDSLNSINPQNIISNNFNNNLNNENQKKFQTNSNINKSSFNTKETEFMSNLTENLNENDKFNNNKIKKTSEKIEENILLEDEEKFNKITEPKNLKENIEKIKGMYIQCIRDLKKINDIKKQIIKLKNFAYEFIQFIFSDDIYYIIIKNRYNENIIEFILLQIYLFLSILYLNLNSDNDFQIKKNSYLNAIIYSSENYLIFLNYIKDFKLSEINSKNFKNQNRIIHSILNLIYNQTPSKKQISEFIQATKENSNNSIINIIELLKNNHNLKEILIKVHKEILILPPFNSNRFKYTLIINLDENIVHYVEEEEKSYVKVRFNTDNFLKNLSEFYEIIFFTSLNKDYADIIIDNIDTEKKYVNFRLYREDTINFNFKNFNKLGRKVETSIIINNYSESPVNENELRINIFDGSEEDKELVYLEQYLIELVKFDENDIREFIPQIQEKINNHKL
jgi:hypothetical protein